MKNRIQLIVVFLLFVAVGSIYCQPSFIFIPYSFEGKWTFVNANLARMTSKEFDEVGPLSEFSWVRKGKRYGYYNLRYGVRLTRIRYRKLSPKRLKKAKEKFYRKYAWLVEKKTFGVCGGSFDSRMCFRFFKEDGKYGLAFWKSSKNMNPNLIYEDGLKFSSVTFNEPVFGKERLKQLMIPTIRFDSLFENGSCLLFGKKDDAWGIYDDKLNLVQPHHFEKIVRMNNYSRKAYLWHKIKKDGLWGVIDDRGKIIIAPKFISISNFRYGLAKVQRQNNKYGYVDDNGQEYFR